jgi:hypothetical protein
LSFGQTYHIGDSLGSKNNNNESIVIKFEQFIFDTEDFRKEYSNEYQTYINVNTFVVLVEGFNMSAKTYDYIIARYKGDQLLFYKILIGLESQLILVYAYNGNETFKLTPFITYHYYTRTWN